MIGAPFRQLALESHLNPVVTLKRQIKAVTYNDQVVLVLVFFQQNLLSFLNRVVSTKEKRMEIDVMSISFSERLLSHAVSLRELKSNLIRFEARRQTFKRGVFGFTYVDQFSALSLLDGVHVELIGAPHALVNCGVQAFLHLLLK